MSKNKPMTFSDLLEEHSDATHATYADEELPFVILGAAYIEQLLTTMLSDFFIEGNTADTILDSMKGALGSLKTKADVAYCLGLTTKTVHTDICLLGTIRNVFAHSHKSMSFDNDKIKELVAQLEIPDVYTVDKVYPKNPDGSHFEFHWTFNLKNWDEPTTRGRFTTAVRFCTDFMTWLMPFIARDRSEQFVEDGFVERPVVKDGLIEGTVVEDEPS